MAKTFLSFSVLAKVSISGSWEKLGCLSPLGVSKNCVEIHQPLLEPITVSVQKPVGGLGSAIEFTAHQS
jgi:hypothetical protein